MWSKRHANKREMFECLNCFKWALQVLTIEQNLSYKKKLENQKIYATMIAEKNSESGRKVMMVRWRQSEEERAEYLTQKLWIQDQIRHMEDAGSVCYEWRAGLGGRFVSYCQLEVAISSVDLK